MASIVKFTLYQGTDFDGNSVNREKEEYLPWGSLMPPARHFTNTLIPYLPNNAFILQPDAYKTIKFTPKQRAEQFPTHVYASGDVLGVNWKNIDAFELKVKCEKTQCCTRALMVELA